MGNETILTDDYVAGLLADESKDWGLRYSAMGLSQYGSSKPANKLKPNTRFLRHIIKETKNHNEALLAKEAAESQARLQDLADAEEDTRRKSRPGPKDVRKRQLGDIAAILGGQKRKRDTENASSEKKPRHEEEQSGSRGTTGRSSRHRDGEERSSRSKSYRHRSREPREASDDETEKERSRSHKRRRRHSVSDDDKKYRSGRKHRDRSRSPRERERRHRHRSPIEDERRSKADSLRLENRIRHAKADTARLSPVQLSERDTGDVEDSDPLEGFIGPRPAVRARGRGAVAGSSGIDSRFSDGYDPTVDVEPDPDTDNWEEALEAFRDRQKWKQQGASRLRAAGFSDDQVTKWERGGERDVDDVKWSMSGDKREWDRGKVVGSDGLVTGKPEWA